ncbi:dirigent protein 21-like [Ananas comosus]|uniref:Dirigent protein n=2 Tax=Ananas comosus TaxID=4615 RepID=A0A6P5GR40_ANACO|nr:dirigent protein 21-like [Ananas comosus]XP_020110365.1 dirigent protein 21-like [Ananas comosus]XP_020110366.1 dirigent protein 21-like [Ananas comosus]
MASLCSFVCHHHHHHLLLFLFAAAVAVAFTTKVVTADDNMTHLHFYMHDILGGSNPTAIEIVKGPVALSSVPGVNFGNLIAIDDALTEGPELSSKPIGRAQGFYMSTAFQEASLLVSVNFVLAADGPYNGSVVSVQGRDPIAAPVRELSVVGGTGQFRMARGYVLWKTYDGNATNGDGVLELDVYVTTYSGRLAPSTTPAAITQSPSVQQSSKSTSTSLRSEFVILLITITICAFLL